MKVILRKNFEKLGNAGEIVEVKDGYAMNFLIPRNIAFVATKGNIRALEEEKVQKAKKKPRLWKMPEHLPKKFPKFQLPFPLKSARKKKSSVP